MSGDFQVTGKNAKALFTLKLHRGDGMALLAMNWKHGRPPDNFVGFAVEYKEPKGKKYYPLKNRLNFLTPQGAVDWTRRPTLQAPIQKFRWVHFPRNANLKGKFTYRVKPVFMDDKDRLTYGKSQAVRIELRRWTYPGRLNVAFTRGFVSSQAFVDYYQSAGPISTLLPSSADKGLKFKPTHPKTTQALQWMGFEARASILDILDTAIAKKKTQVRMVAYDLNDPEIVSRLEKLGSRLKVIIDNSGSHKKKGSAENEAETRLVTSAGRQNVKRQHVGGLQHNKTIVAEGPGVHLAVCGSTNFSWRGLYVQNNNAVVLQGTKAVKPFIVAFDNYWTHGTVGAFGKTASVQWTNLGLRGIDAKVAFSPHAKSNALLKSIADDINTGVKSSLFYSLAFLYQTPGVILNAIKKVTKTDQRFVYGISDRKVGGIDLQKPNGNVAPVYPSALTKNVPEPFKSEPKGGGGVRMHHKFVVIDFDKPSARVYLGSYNFSKAADTKNGENLMVIRDKRIAVSFAIEALTMFDHYHFRVAKKAAKKAKKKLALARPPRRAGEIPWWSEDYTDARKKLDRQLFA